MVSLFKDLYRYRELLKNNVKKDIRGKYKGTWLGIIWSFLNPLLLLAIYSIIFPLILKVSVENYTLYLMVALIPWTFFTTTVQLGAFSVINNGSLLKKVYFPREIIPISVVTSGFINYMISSVITVLFLIFSNIGISYTILLFPLIAIIQYMLILGITFIFSALTVYVRDLEHFIGLGLMVMFYITPIVYTSSSLPANYKWILTINPMAYIIESYRNILYYKTMPNFTDLGVIFIISFMLFYIGLLIFRKLQKNFVEEL